MFDSCEDLARELDEVETELADPSIHADQAAARKLGRRYAQLRPVVAAYREWRALHEDHLAAVELAELGMTPSPTRQRVHGGTRRARGRAAS